MRAQYPELGIILFFLLFSQVCQGEMYKWRDAAGNLHFSDKAPSSHQNSNQSIEKIRVKPANVVRSNTDVKGLSEQMREDRETKEQNRRDKEMLAKQKLRSAASSWKTRNCGMVQVPQYRGNVNGTVRIHGYIRQQQCSEPMPEKFKPFLSP